MGCDRLMPSTLPSDPDGTTNGPEGPLSMSRSAPPSPVNQVGPSQSTRCRLGVLSDGVGPACECPPLRWVGGHSRRERRGRGTPVHAVVYEVKSALAVPLAESGGRQSARWQAGERPCGRTGASAQPSVRLSVPSAGFLRAAGSGAERGRISPALVHRSSPLWVVTSQKIRGDRRRPG